METTPVFMFTGFVESGKTTMIQRWLTQDFFRQQEKVVVIACEDGFTEYENLADNVVLYMVENKEDFNADFLAGIEKKDAPTAILLENNCMVSVDEVLDVEWPENWDLVQISAIIDASVFEQQMKNMRSIMTEQFRYATVAVFNRCDENTKKLQLRASVKAVNPEASLMFIRKDGTADEELDELPFDIEAPVINIDDIDFGLWFVDVFENYQRYNRKTVRFKGIAARPQGYPKNSFLVGRYAMTCCADDMAYLKLLCVDKKDVRITEGEWVTVTAEVQICQPAGMEEPSPVFYLKNLEKAQAPETELVYFS
ncbi:MAG: GTPase [Ruminococcus sp.]|nr:GTPase [Ruminococcus sp.]